ncbi:preprotein translocase subunit SecA [Candidatus Peregrinibacteria bacterium CG10_big_fil_rev_8_21_14_0_10_49_16]|nr:MAG: preprotein translocase subunit SecA [Candidatus Peregrinibacteria bacterium CG22_combo_CG10-13_8_21_14_all_49_11]PIR52282.1 MAG: preprotein translocase subunit SecA [Candidatus Peregrinibacteria bacterium CG10_big_fil_rev_8_21_14_0_10_49_16]
MSFLDALNTLLGDPNEKELRKLWPLVHQVKEVHQSSDIQALTLSGLPRKTEELQQVAGSGERLDDLLPEAFATVIRACELLQGQAVAVGRQEFTWNMVPFDVQILGGIALHRGMICEMKTGEGKTLVCTMPVYLNALSGKGVHVITVNDYLAKRDAGWMGLLYETLGLTTGVILHGKSSQERQQAYGADVTYGTNNEFGFDYLRDNMATSVKTQVQRGLHYAIVDEVDSILIDEARTPLIISQPAEESTTKYLQYARLVQQLEDGKDFTKDEKGKTAVLTEEGVATMEQLLGVENIYTDKGFEEVHHIEQALRAHAMYQKDVDYVERDGQIVIVDEFTGRLMPGRRYSHGLHQAIEAKEGVEVQRESKTLATITFQNYFRLYGKLAGMTGTAKTEEEEFESIYKTRTLVVPTHRPLARTDKPDAIYRTLQAKFMAVVKLAKEKYEKGQPMLIGTVSIEKSEVLSALLQREGVPHEVLNAKHHEREAEIVADAGQKGAVTIATNMAGRGTDIKLGEGVAELGGLCIIGTERHESRRIDNQLRGRSGRQGDPGESQFFVSMEDDLMRLFGGDRMKRMMERLNIPDDVPLQNPMVSRSIEGAQKKVEGRNFDIRRHVLQYDNTLSKHREIMYTRRQQILEKIAESEGSEGTSEEGWSLHDDILRAIEREVVSILSAHTHPIDPDEWNLEAIHDFLMGLHPEINQELPLTELQTLREKDVLQERCVNVVKKTYDRKCERHDPETVAQAERVITLRSIDTHWMDHIDAMAHLREQVAFSGYAQRDPLIEYQDQGFRLFEQLLTQINTTLVHSLLQVDFAQFQPMQVLQQAAKDLQGMMTNEDEIQETKDVKETKGSKEGPLARVKAQGPITQEKVGRNDPCPCGSGKKYKKCCGREP